MSKAKSNVELSQKLYSKSLQELNSNPRITTDVSVLNRLLNLLQVPHFSKWVEMSETVERSYCTLYELRWNLSIMEENVLRNLRVNPKDDQSLTMSVNVAKALENLTEIEKSSSLYTGSGVVHTDLPPAKVVGIRTVQNDEFCTVYLWIDGKTGSYTIDRIEDPKNVQSVKEAVLESNPILKETINQWTKFVIQTDGSKKYSVDKDVNPLEAALIKISLYRA